MSTQTSSYRIVKAVSNSTLTEFESDIRTFRDWWLFDTPFKEQDDEYLTLGSIVDTKLTNKEEFNNKYYVFKEVPPKPQMVTFCRNLLPIYNPKENIEEQLQIAYNLSNIKSPGFENTKEKFNTECEKYFSALLDSIGKTVITAQQYKEANKIAEELKSNEFTSEIINAISTNDLHVFNQLEIYTYYKAHNGVKIPVKGALDKVIIDHSNRTVYPYDLKTSSSLNEFIGSYIKYRYYRQASYYSNLLRSWMVEQGIGNYRLADFKFIVASTNGGGAYLYKVSRSDIMRSMTGGITALGLKYKGWKQLLDEIGWHIETGKWDYPYEVYRNNGILTLSAFKYGLNTLDNVA